MLRDYVREMQGNLVKMGGLSQEEIETVVEN
jgi:hypothetical protein